MDAPTLCTVCTAARLPHALALADGWRAAGGAGTPLVVVADALPGTLPAADGVRLVAGAELGIDDFDLLAGEHDARALATVLVPFALAAAGAPAVYLAPDAEVLAPIALPAAELVLAARGGEGPPVADPGFAGLPAPQPELLAWWQGRVRDAGATTAWHDVLLGRFAGVELAHDPAWAVAAWNLDERGIDASGAALTTADGAPVAWLALPGVEGTELPGVELDARPALRAALERRAAAVARHAGVAVPAGYAETATGLPLGDELRTLAARRARRAGPRAVALRSGRGGRVPGLARGAVGRAGVRRGPAARVPALGPAGRAARRVSRPDARSRPASATWAGSPPAARSSSACRPRCSRPRRRSTPSPARRAARPARPWGVNVAGYFQSELGIGGVARGVIEALDAAHVPILPVQGSIPPPSRRGRDFGSTGAGVAPFAVNLICVNADGLPQFVRDVGEAFFSGRRSIGLWWWEVEDFPDRYHGAFEHLDEVWVGSRHVQRAIAPHAPVPGRPRAGPAARPAAAAPHPGRARRPRGLPRARHLRLQLGAEAQEPGRRDRRVRARVRAGQRRLARGEERQRGAPPDGARGAAARRGCAPARAPARRLPRRGGRARAAGRRRRLPLPAPVRGLRARPGGGDGARHARGRHRLLRQPRVHGRRRRAGWSPTRSSRSGRTPARTRRTASGRSPTSRPRPRRCARSATTPPRRPRAPRGRTPGSTRSTRRGRRAPRWRAGWRSSGASSRRRSGRPRAGSARSTSSWRRRAAASGAT